MATASELAEQWLRVDRDPTTRKEIESLVLQNDKTQLEARLLGRITFGTAGLRAQMGAGFTRMNAVTVIQASQGLAAYVINQIPNARNKGIVIGHDARHNSERFAKLTAAAFMAKGLKVHWFPKIVATPLVPFVVSENGAAVGVMITASHNPSQDNGYKVYWSNGCQIIPPHDTGIAAAIENNLEPEVWEFQEVQGLFHTVDEQIEISYYKRIVGHAKLAGPLPTFVYTPMHGVGLPFFLRATYALSQTASDMASANAKGHFEDRFVAVPAQASPDPDFPTVAFPNPEEHGALDLAMETANEHDIRLIIANDPDADRLAVAELVHTNVTSQTTTSRWHHFTGNEIGILLASYALYLYQSSDHAGKLAMLCSTVSSDMLRAMAEAEGFHFAETLTGFKWLGNVAQDLAREGYDVKYAFEEALGYMFPDVVSDKDGIASGTIFLAATSFWKVQSLTPYQKLQQLYRKYGYFADANTYLISPNALVTSAAFAAIRASEHPHPTMLGSHKILRWRDLTVGYDSATEDQKPKLPIDQASQMITCELASNVRFTVRGSGTEPKIKLYIESRGETHQEAKRKAVEVQKVIIAQWFSPEKYGLMLAG